MTPRRSKATMSTGIGLRARSTNTVAQTLIRLVAQGGRCGGRVVPAQVRTPR